MTHNDPKIMKFSFVPLGDETIASSRLRCYKIRNELDRLGFSTRIGYDKNCDILFIQKNTDEEVIEFALQSKRNASILIFDVDDFPESLAFRKNAQVLASLADAVTTSTPEQKTLVCQYFKGISEKKVFSFPNPIDYELDEPKSRIHEESTQLKLVWFGNIENYPSHLVKALCSYEDLEFHAITNASADIKCQYPACRFHDWSYKDFSDTLSRFDVCLLSHQGSKAYNAKSANKMITAIVHGLPVIASSTSDYRRLAQLANVEDWLFDDEKSLLSRIGQLRDPAQRNAFITTTQQVVWNHFHIEKVLPLFLNIVRQTMTLSPYTDSSSVLQRNIPRKTIFQNIVNRIRH